MLMRGDLDLNSMRAYTGSLDDVVRKTMLSQEIMFKKQVHELHHLYRIQKTLMQNLGRMEFGRYNHSIAGADFNLLPRRNYGRDEHMDLLERCKGVDDKIQPRNPELKLHTDQCISYIDPAELKLSLSIQEDNRKEGGTKRIWFDLETHSCSQHMIDLEEPIERTSNEGLEQSPSFSSTAPITSARGTNNSEVSVLFDPIISSSVKKNIFFHAAESNPHLDGSEWNPFNQGLEKRSGGIAINNSSTTRQHFGSYETGLLDLNKIQNDDSSCLSNDHTVAHFSTASSSHLRGLVSKVEEGTHCYETGKKLNNNGSIETLERFQKYNAGNVKVDGSSISGMGNVSLEAAPRSKIDLQEAVGFHSNDSSNGNNGFVIKLLNSRSSSCTSARQVNCENNKVEDPVFSYTDHCRKVDPDGHGNISSASCKPCCIGEDDSRSVKTMQSEIEYGTSNPFSVDQFSGTHVGSQVSETLMGEQDRRSSDNSELKHKDLDKGGDSAELNVLIRAAEALVRISLESSSCCHDCTYEVGGANKMETKGSEQPQCSSDSYELLTLNLIESTEDDYCVSLKPSEVNYNDSKEFGVKLRRGRRMKDFQRDILPGLASLSRHEIREDINIMETVLRSREYKKLRGKVADYQSWCTPVKNKRSRLNYVPRRKRNL
ncbi:uncharacterized protein LOC126626461 isoform X1 [Malus sylvestris]|uniref:uncharacterized protein LOC126626461 isoform X1 n=2 Tax=Malus sylvestris TaxID=3752 RepID=UPI0021AD2D80|nr:uncharacterized protein LOC126626461 isoform X1 [Malus sylvestris]XP_050151742.1 uncharacterized protein LOC126626461 isoform X1 [Malus sylvestris]